jgi:hypothetical protein
MKKSGMPKRPVNQASMRVALGLFRRNLPDKEGIFEQWPFLGAGHLSFASVG